MASRPFCIGWAWPTRSTRERAVVVTLSSRKRGEGEGGALDAKSPWHADTTFKLGARRA